MDMDVDTTTGEIRGNGMPRQLQHPLVADVPRGPHRYEVKETVIRSLTLWADDIAAASEKYEARLGEAEIVSRTIAVKDKGIE
jgi:hypothetical protein